jgi:hypothetical protein
MQCRKPESTSSNYIHTYISIVVYQFSHRITYPRVQIYHIFQQFIHKSNRSSHDASHHSIEHYIYYGLKCTINFYTSYRWFAPNEAHLHHNQFYAHTENQATSSLVYKPQALRFCQVRGLTFKCGSTRYSFQINFWQILITCGAPQSIATLLLNKRAQQISMFLLYILNG